MSEVEKFSKSQCGSSIQENRNAATRVKITGKESWETGDSQQEKAALLTAEITYYVLQNTRKEVRIRGSQKGLSSRHFTSCPGVLRMDAPCGTVSPFMTFN